MLLGTTLASADCGPAGQIRGVAALIAHITETRLLTPDTEIWAEAGVIAGTLARCQGYQRHQRKECLNDALIYLTAAKAGLPVLTANRDALDLIQQRVPSGRFIHFQKGNQRRAPAVFRASAAIHISKKR
jgi:hypothetical protein